MKKEQKKQFTMIPKDNDEFYALSERLNILHLYIVERVRGFDANGLVCYLSNEQLANETNCSVSTIKRAIKLLVEMKILWAGYHQESVKNKQRIMRIFNEKIQNDHQRVSKCTPEKVKLPSKGNQNEPLVYNKKENNKLLTNNNERENKFSGKRKIEDLEFSEGGEIVKAIEKGIPYVELAKKYNLEYGVLTKDFKNKWLGVICARECEASMKAEMERRKKEPHIDYSAYERPISQEEKEHDAMMDEMMEEFLHGEPEEESKAEPATECEGEPAIFEILRKMGEEKKAKEMDSWECFLK